MQAMVGLGKKRRSVRARSIVCFWAGKELGMSLTELAGRLGISCQPLVWRCLGVNEG